MLLQVLYHGQNHGFVLVVAGKAQRLEVGQAADVMDEALDIPLHFQGGVPVLEGEHGAPVKPEVGVQHLVAKEVSDAFVIELLIGGKEQLHDLHGSLVGHGELAVGVRVLPPIDGGTAQGVVGIFLVQPVILVQHTDALGLNGGDGVEQIPHDLEMVVHLTAAPHDIAHVLKLPAVAGAAGDGILLKDVDVLALHLAVPNQIAGGGKSGKAGADDIGGLVIHTLRFPGAGKSLVVTAGIIHI